MCNTYNFSIHKIELRMRVHVRYMYRTCHVVFSNCRPLILKCGYTTDCDQQQGSVTSKLIFSRDHAVWKDIAIFRLRNVHSVYSNLQNQAEWREWKISIPYEMRNVHNFLQFYCEVLLDVNQNFIEETTFFDVAKILRRRIEKKIEDVLGEDQFGFRRGKGTRDAIGMMRITVEWTLEIYEELCICFIDWQKAFDRVNWTKLMQILKRIGIDWRERRLISKLYVHGVEG